MPCLSAGHTRRASGGTGRDALSRRAARGPTPRCARRATSAPSPNRQAVRRPRVAEFRWAVFGTSAITAKVVAGLAAAVPDARAAWRPAFLARRRAPILDRRHQN